MTFFRYLAYRFLHSLCAAVDCSLYDWPERLSDYEAQQEVWESRSDHIAQNALDSLRDAEWPHGKAYDGWPDAERARRESSSAPMSDGQAVSGAEETARLGSNPPTPAGPPASAK